jgi:hypothetical protein
MDGMNVWMKEIMDGLDEWMDEWTDEWMDG